MNRTVSLIQWYLRVLNISFEFPPLFCNHVDASFVQILQNSRRASTNLLYNFKPRMRSFYYHHYYYYCYYIWGVAQGEISTVLGALGGVQGNYFYWQQYKDHQHHKVWGESDLIFSSVWFAMADGNVGEGLMLWWSFVSCLIAKQPKKARRKSLDRLFRSTINCNGWKESKRTSARIWVSFVLS